MKKILEFYGENCLGCRMLKPIMHEYIKENPDIVLEEISIDTEEGMNTARKYNVRSLPTVVFIKDDTVTGWFVGTCSLGDINTKAMEAFA